MYNIVQCHPKAAGEMLHFLSAEFEGVREFEGGYYGMLRLEKSSVVDAAPTHFRSPVRW